MQVGLIIRTYHHTRNSKKTQFFEYFFNPSFLRLLYVHECIRSSDSRDPQSKSKRRAQLELEANTHWRDEIGEMPMYRMFCSEFVAVCYQARGLLFSLYMCPNR